MVRVPLEELVLQIHLLALGKAGSFLARVLQVWWGRAGHPTRQRCMPGPCRARSPSPPPPRHLLHLATHPSAPVPFLSPAVQPPPDKSVAGAIRTLQEVGALTAGEELTPLGEHMHHRQAAGWPLPPARGRAAQHPWHQWGWRRSHPSHACS